SLRKPPGVVEFYGLDIYESIRPEFRKGRGFVGK
ncbi:hypothetical protein A2U01_0097576, partial [Trifolium medium]|nr:hypothetical protein [Trifolium medium]